MPQVIANRHRFANGLSIDLVHNLSMTHRQIMVIRCGEPLSVRGELVEPFPFDRLRANGVNINRELRLLLQLQEHFNQ